MVPDLAEGAGQALEARQRRYYLTARGSATESAALLDVLTARTKTDGNRARSEVRGGIASAPASGYSSGTTCWATLMPSAEVVTIVKLA